LIGKKDKYVNSKSISGLIQDIDYKSSDIFKNLGSLTKIPESKKLMSNFSINCSKLTRGRNMGMKELHSYILDCEDYLSVKNINWYEVALGLKPFDDEFENAVLSELKHRRIIIDTDKFHYGLKLLVNDEKVKKIFKHRILECGHKPQGFFDKLFGTISWDSYNECFKCSDNSCIVQLDENYKTFLNQKHKIMTVDKIKILIYVELRLRELSKHFALEAVRINNDKTSKIVSLLNKIYDQDNKVGNVSTNSLKQFVMKRDKQTGGAEEPLPEPVPLAEEPLPEAEAPLPEATPPEEPLAEEPLPEATPEPTPEPLPEEPLAEATQPAEEPLAEEPLAEEPLAEATQPAEEPLPEAPLPEATPPEAPLPEATQPEEPLAEATQLPEPDGKGDTPVEGDKPADESDTSVLEEKTPTFSKMIYVSFNGSISDDKAKETVANQVAENMRALCNLNNTSRLKVYRVRIAPRTVSVEIGIEDKKEGELSDKDIKDNIVKAIVDKSITKKLIVIELDTVKDIYFDGISKYDELKDMPSQVKRVLLEMDGKYPEKESERTDFEDKIITNIVTILEEPTLDLERLHLENVTNISGREGRVYVQFLLMNGLYEKKSPHELLMKLKEKCSVNDGDNEFTKEHGISNVVFGEPSVILDNENVETMKTLSEEKEDTKSISEGTFEDLESNYKRIAYFGCDLTIDDIKNNKILSHTPLSPECEDTLNKYLRGY